MPRKHPSRTVRQCLDTMGDEEFRSFARMITNPPRGVVTKKPTAEELREIKARMEKLR